MLLPWCWEGLGAGGEGDGRGWDGWMASPTWWTWVWVNSGSWWWTGRPGMLQFIGSQRVRHDWATELNRTELNWCCYYHFLSCVYFLYLSFFSPLCFLPKEVPLAFVVKLVWCQILLTLACLESLLFLHQIWRRGFLGRVFLVMGSSLSSLAILFWPVNYCWEISWYLMGFSVYVICLFSLVAINILSLSLIFISLITVCLGVLLLGFILPGTLCASWTGLTISFLMVGKFSAIISSNIFSGPFSFSRSFLPFSLFFLGPL